jgi:hypothetical protein
MNTAMSTTLSTRPPPAATLDAAQGLWQYVRDEPVADDGGRQANDCFTFRLDGDHVVLRLFTLNADARLSPDDFFRLAARWQGRMLQYRPPFGDWADLARFERGRFVDIGNGKRRIFARIEPSEVAAFNRDILRPRKAHRYGQALDGDHAR